MYTISIFVLVLVTIFSGHVGNVQGEQLVWRNPGRDGYWFDPHNWIALPSNLSRVPGPDDDVILASPGVLTTGAPGFHIIIDARNGPVVVNSLSIKECLACGTGPVETFWFYDNSTWQETTYFLGDFGERCGFYLSVIAPTQLVVKTALTIGLYNVLELVGSPSNPLMRSTINAQQLIVYGTIVGSADFNVRSTTFNFGAVLQFAYIASITAYNASPRGGLMNWIGNLDLSSADVALYADWDNSDLSHLNVYGALTLPINIYLTNTPPTNVSDLAANFFEFASYGGPSESPYYKTLFPKTYDALSPGELGSVRLPCISRIVIAQRTVPSCSVAASHHLLTVFSTSTATPDCSDSCANDCHHHGSCISGVCHCHKQWTGNSCELPHCPGQTESCSGHGTCSNRGTCQCNNGWGGHDCSLPLCEGTNGCSHHGQCILDSISQGTKCQCYDGWSGSNCDVPQCINGCSGHGYCSDELDPPRCICNNPITLVANQPTGDIHQYYGWTGADCSIGVAPYCPFSDCAENGGTCTFLEVCDTSAVSVDFQGWDASEYVCSNTGYPECSGQGACTLNAANNPQCVCRPGFILGSNNDCQQATCDVYGCSGHGRCRTDLATPTCECDAYYYGADCSIGAH